MKRYALLPLLLLTVSLSAINCSKNPSGELIPENYDGTWYGNTSQGKSFSFTVSGNSITSLTMGYSLSGNCSFTPSGVQITFYTPQPVNGKAFSISGDTKVNGNFSSAKTANGTFSVNFSGVTGGCNATANGTWSANK